MAYNPFDSVVHENDAKNHRNDHDDEELKLALEHGGLISVINHVETNYFLVAFLNKFHPQFQLSQVLTQW
jgi:hypothetical protein